MSFRLVLTKFTMIALAISATQVYAVTYEIRPDEATSKDTLAYQGTPAINYNVGPFGAYLGAVTTESGHSGRSFLDFVLPGINATDVLSASLVLQSQAGPFGQPVSPSAAPNIQVFAVTQAWTANSVTWNSQPTYDSSPYASAIVSSPTQQVTFDVTDLVKGWLDGSIDQFGLALAQELTVLNGADQPVGVAFWSASGAINDRPLLQITAVPEPAGATLLALGAAAYFSFKRFRRKY